MLRRRKITSVMPLRDSGPVVVIRRSDNMIDVTVDGLSPTPPVICELLSRQLSYMHKVHLRGREAYDYATHQYIPVRLENRALYTFSPDGKFTTQAGYLPRVCRLLESAGYSPRYCDLSPPRSRPGCYTPNLKQLSRYMQLRPKQDVCLANMLAATAAGCGGIVWAPTGFGKTFTIEAWCHLHPTARIDVVVKPVDVAKRIVRQLSEHIPCVGQIGGGQRRYGRVTVVTADSLHLSEGDADFLIVDECHQIATDIYAAQLATTYRSSINFGLSATPYSRSDGAHARLEGLFGQLLFRMTYQEAVDLGLVVPIRVRWLPIRMTTNPASGMREANYKRNAYWRNTYRNNEFAKAARSYPPDQQTLLLVESVEHAVHLRQMLPEYALCYGSLDPGELANYVEQGLLSADEPRMVPERREFLRSEFEKGTLKKVIATDVWSTGVSFDSLSAMLRADGRGSEIIDTQGPGRVSRIYEGKPYGELVDAIDYFDSAAMAKSQGRRRTYDSLGWSQDWPMVRGRAVVS
jgi:superfamily II DNA or RNA helicase